MICKKSDQHHTLLKRQIRAFLQTDLKKQILNILRTGCTISSPNIQIFSEWARPGQCSQHQVFSKYSIWKYFRSNKQKTKTKRMRLVQALVAECQLCSYFVQLHRIHYKRRTLNLQIKHRQCWFNNFESTCSLLNCRLQFLCPSCISLMFKQHPSITFFCQHPSTYFWQHPSQYLDAGRRPSNWWALHRQKPMQLKMR